MKRMWILMAMKLWTCDAAVTLPISHEIIKVLRISYVQKLEHFSLFDNLLRLYWQMLLVGNIMVMKLQAHNVEVTLPITKVN